MVSESSESTIDYSLPTTETSVPTDTWLWGSIVVIAKVPLEGTKAMDKKHWSSVQKCDFPVSKLASRSANEIDEYLSNRRECLDYVSTNWFKRTASNKQFIVTSTCPETSMSGIPTHAFNNLPVVQKVRSAGITVVGISRTRRESTSEDCRHEYVAIHLNLNGDALRNPTLVPAALHRPTRVTQLVESSHNSTVRGSDLKSVIDMALSASGINAHLNNGGALVPEDAHNDWGHIYTISTLVPGSQLPVCREEFAGEHEIPDRATRWAHEMSIARSNTPTPALADLSEEGIRRCVVSLGSMVGWCSERGMGLVAGIRPSSSNKLWIAEVGHAIVLAHSVFVDLAVLVMQQDKFLETRANSLSNLAEQGVLNDVTASLAEYKKIQASYIDFHGKKWVQEIPTKESTTRVLKVMQDVRMLEQRVKHSLIEQRAIVDYLEAAQSQEQELERLEKHKQEVEKANLEALDRDRAQKFSHKVNLLAFIFFPATLIFTFTGGMGVPIPWYWTVVCLTIAIGASLWLYFNERKRD